jgi:uncharacterized protein with PQ loop repeat
MIMAASTFTTSLAIIAPIITIFQAGAQAARIRRTGAKGVSLGTWLLSAFVAEVWLCYGFVFHVPAEIAANVPCLIVASTVAFLAAQSQERMARSLVGYAGLSLVTVLATFAGTFHQYRWIMATVAVTSSVVIYLPQLALVIRPRDLSGVSAISWATACVTALCWLVYGFLIHQPAVALPSVVMLPSAIIILIQVLRHRIKNDPLHGVQAPINE